MNLNKRQDVKRYILTIISIVFFWTDPETGTIWFTDDPKTLPAKATNVQQREVKGLEGYEKWTIIDQSPTEN